MKAINCITCCLMILGILSGCEDDKDFSPPISYKVEFNDSLFQYHNGDSLYGCVTILQDSLITGTDVKKIDCRLGNIVIGTVKNELVCPFGVRLKDKPAGKHTFSVIIKYEVPGYDETFLRTNHTELITIKD
ncbi:MAG: hypothetical protein IJX44_08815 [Bacteroidaceae bacterium]|nr:hypothetical protein [Bacteroidaceae bacterium]